MMTSWDGISIDCIDGAVRLSWQKIDDPEKTAQLLLATADSIFTRGLTHRVEARVITTDRQGLHALHLARFRREGRLRSSLCIDGIWVDQFCYSLLKNDHVASDEAFCATMDTVLPTHRIIARTLIRNEIGHILMVETTYHDEWTLPGGVVEEGESPLAGAQRETHEEIGYDPHLGSLLHVGWMPPYNGWSDAVEFTFDGGVIDNDQAKYIVPSDDEIADIHWTDLSQCATHMSVDSYRRLQMMLDRRIYSD